MLCAGLAIKGRITKEYLALDATLEVIKAFGEAIAAERVGVVAILTEGADQILVVTVERVDRGIDIAIVYGFAPNSSPE